MNWQERGNYKGRFDKRRNNYTMPIDDKTLVGQFIAYKQEYYQASPDSLRTYIGRLTAFSKFLHNIGSSLRHVKTEEILAYKDSKKLLRNNTISTDLSPIRMFYAWMAHPTVQIIDRSPFPGMRLEGGSMFEGFIPTAQQIFKIRVAQPLKYLRQITAFEMMLSSGMRINELRRVKLCDIRFKVGCIYDAGLQKESPFVGGWLTLRQDRGFRIKGRDKRRVYFSKLAAKLLKRYIEVQRLDQDPRLPLWPFTSQAINTWQNDCFEVIEDEVEQPIQNRDGFWDIDTEEHVNNKSLSAQYRKSLRKRQENIEKQKKAIPLISKVRIEPAREKITLTNHGLRHFYAMLMYYRSWSGTHHDVQTVATLLGHRNIQTTYEYMHKVEPVCHSFSDWKRILIGNGMDYRNCLE